MAKKVNIKKATKKELLAIAKRVGCYGEVKEIFANYKRYRARTKVIALIEEKKRERCNSASECRKRRNTRHLYMADTPWRKIHGLQNSDQIACLGHILKKCSQMLSDYKL